MVSKSFSKQDTPNSTQAEAHEVRHVGTDDECIPMYYDSEPSSQPPKYLNIQSAPAGTSSDPQSTASHTVISTSSATKPPNQHRNSAPAATVAAILAFPNEDLDAQRRTHRKSRTLRQRWKDFKNRNFHNEDGDVGGAGVGSAAEWNVMGGKLSGGQPSPYRKKERK